LSCIAEYSVDELVAGVYGAVEPLAAEKKLSLSTIVPPGLPPARGDERRLAQALPNLVGNAIKFTDKGEVAIEVAAGKEALTFSVRDTGPGIADADQTKISRNSSSWTARSPRLRWVRDWVLRSQSALSRCMAVAFGSIPGQARARLSPSRHRRESNDG
jgi:Histidine kinase-, DNA gyrase B-, and HSP90-like ATPase